MYPPNLYPFVVSINVIVIPLLSHLLWKSLGVEPSLVFLNNNSELKFLLFNHDIINSSSNSILESNLFPIFICPNVFNESKSWFTPSSLGKNTNLKCFLLYFLIFSFILFILLILFSIFKQSLINSWLFIITWFYLYINNNI